MANPLMGEYEIELNGISYTLKLTMSVIAAYENELNTDFMADAYDGINAMVQAAVHKDQPAKYASILCRAVSRDQAATLVYLAAKESNSQVELGEIHEAFLVDHALDDAKFHPAIFTTLALFAIRGKEANKKKRQFKSWSSKIEKPEPIDFMYWLQVACKELNIQPSEFWDMPFFVIYNTLKRSTGNKEDLTRVDVLDQMRDRKQRLGWV